MAIETHLDLLLVERKMASKELARRINLSENNLSRIKTGNIKAIRWSTLEAICRELNCQPGDLLEYVPEPEGAAEAAGAVDVGVANAPSREVKPSLRPATSAN